MKKKRKGKPRAASRPRRRVRRPKQTSLVFRTRGGRRKGAGRKPNGARPGVPHRQRQRLSGRAPVLVTMKMASSVPRLRRNKVHGVVRRALWKARVRFGTRINHYSLQSNHLHLIVEAHDAASLSRAMQGFAVRIAKGVNRVFSRKGKVFADRYHARALETPAEVRAALCYVLNNSRRHAHQRGTTLPPDWVDPMSSGPHFTGWRPTTVDPEHSAVGPNVCAPPTTWLLSKGWLRRGRIGIDEIPGRRRR